MLVLRTLPLETVLEGDTGFVQAALEPCVHTATCRAVWDVAVTWLRHHSYIQIAFRDPTLFLFSMGHSMPKAGNPPCVSTSQKRRAGDKLQHCVFQTDYETKNERQVWTFLQPFLSSRRARATCHYKHWDIWNGFMWVHGVWMFVRGKSLILCSFPWQAAPASAWQHT